MKLQAIFLIALLAACSSDVSDRSITADIDTQATYGMFLKKDHPMVFVVSEDGKSWAYQACNEAGACDLAIAKITALRGCEGGSDGVPCRLYYEHPHGVVWDGPRMLGLDAPSTTE